jgi:hypothetical protein
LVRPATVIAIMFIVCVCVVQVFMVYPGMVYMLVPKLE